MEGARRKKPMKKIIAVFALALAVLVSAPVVHAQKGKVYRIGYLSRTSAKTYRRQVTSFRQELRKLGYTEGKNLVIEERYAAGNHKRYREMTDELVRLNLDMIVVHGLGFAPRLERAMKKVGRTVPIVFAVGVNPVGRGVVASLARPGGNITGVTDFHGELVSKRLELMKEIVPSASRIGVFSYLNNPSHPFRWKTIREAASALGVTLVRIRMREPSDIAPAFEAIKKEGAEALVIFGAPWFSARARQLAELAIKYRLPSTYGISKYPKAGGLMAYGANFDDIYRRVAHHVDKILKGAKPADIPVERPRKFNLVINLKTAKALGITIPPEVLLRATKVIK